jgi:8-oxo-dGTP pyrophosphatase MutT (NUDIX family)
MTGSQLVRPARFTFVAAVHLFLVRDGAVLLLRRWNTGYEDGRYSVIAGHLDGDETVYTAMIREAHEEAGITIAPANLAVVGVMQRRATAPGDDERIDFFLAATAWTGTIVNAELHKCDDLAWYPLDHLPDNIVPYVRRALANYRAGVWFDTLGWPSP